VSSPASSARPPRPDFAPSKTLRDEQPMQVSQRGERDARRANLHAGAGDRITPPQP
jgi:hypothetical protein